MATDRYGTYICGGSWLPANNNSRTRDCALTHERHRRADQFMCILLQHPVRTDSLVRAICSYSTTAQCAHTQQTVFFVLPQDSFGAFTIVEIEGLGYREMVSLPLADALRAAVTCNKRVRTSASSVTRAVNG